jgi:hypothetical protein
MLKDATPKSKASIDRSSLEDTPTHSLVSDPYNKDQVLTLVGFTQCEGHTFQEETSKGVKQTV